MQFLLFPDIDSAVGEKSILVELSFWKHIDMLFHSPIFCRVAFRVNPHGFPHLRFHLRFTLRFGPRKAGGDIWGDIWALMGVDGVPSMSL